MPFITDSFGRQMQHGQNELDVNQMKSLLMNDVKMNSSKKAMKSESPEKVKARKVIEDLLAKIVKQDVGEELKKLREVIDRLAKINEEHYDKEKKQTTKSSMGDIVSLGKIVGEAVKAAMATPAMTSFIDKKQSVLDTKSYELNKKWFDLEEKMSRLATKDYRINYLDARQKGILAGKERATPREAVLVDRQRTSEKQREDIASKPVLTSAYKYDATTVVAETKWQEATADATVDLAKAGLEKGSIYTHDEGTHRLLNYMIQHVHKKIRPGMSDLNAKAKEYTAATTGHGHGHQNTNTNMPPGAKNTNTPPASNIPVTSPWAWDKRTFHRMFSPDRIAATVGRAMMSERPVQEMLLASKSGIGAITSGALKIPILGKALKSIPVIGGSLEGLVDELTTFLVEPAVRQMSNLQDVRQMAFQTEGINVGNGGVGGIKAQTEALKDYTMGSAEVATTGQNLIAIQKTQLNNWKRGIRDAQTLNKVTVTGLHTATMLGSTAEETTRLFADWHQNLGMSTTDLSLMSIGLRDVARTTGLTGDNLIKVAQSSEKFMSNMRMAGTLNTVAGTNITRLMAEATTTGTQESMQRMLSIMSKGMLNGEGDPRARSLAIMAAGNNPNLMNQMMAGTAARNPANMKQMAENMQGTLNTFTGGRKLADIDPNELGIISQVIESAFGVGAQEFQLLIDNFRKAGRSFTDRYSELQGTDAKSIENRQALVFGQTATYIDALKKNGGDFDKLVQEMPDFANFAKTMGVGKENTEEQLRKLLIGREGGLEDKVKAIGKIITRDAAGNEIAQTSEQVLAELKNAPFEKILEIEQKVANQTRANQDPLSRIEQSVKEIQAMLTKLVNFGLLDAHIITDALYKTIDFIRDKQWNKLKELWVGLGADLQKELGTILSWWWSAIKEVDVGQIVNWWWDTMKASIKEWPEQIKTALASIDWKGAGKQFGDWLKSVFTKDNLKAVGAFVADNWKEILVLAFVGTYEILATVVGGIFKGIGEFIEGLGKSIAEAFPAFGHFIEALGRMFEGIGSILLGFSDWIVGFLTGDMKKMTEGTKEMLGGLGTFVLGYFNYLLMGVYTIFEGFGELILLTIESIFGKSSMTDGLRKFFVGMINGIQSWFDWLYDYLLGHSIIPDIVEGIIHWFAKLPRALGEMFKKLGDQFDNEFIKGIFVDFSYIGEGFADLMESISDILTGNWTKETTNKMWHGIKSIFVSVPKMIIDLLGLIAQGTAVALAKIFGGNDNNSFFGAIVVMIKNIFKNASGILAGLSQILDGFVNGDQKAMSAGWELIKKNFVSFFSDLVEDLHPVFTRMGDMIGKGIMDGLTAWFTPTSITPMLIKALSAIDFWDVALTILFPPLGIARVLDKMFPGNNIWDIALGILFPPLGIAKILNNMFPKLAQTISDGGNLLVAAFKDVMGSILNGIRNLLKNNFRPLWDAAGLEDKWKEVGVSNVYEIQERERQRQIQKRLTDQGASVEPTVQAGDALKNQTPIQTGTKKIDADLYKSAQDAFNETQRKREQDMMRKMLYENSSDLGPPVQPKSSIDLPEWLKEAFKLIENPIDDIKDAALKKGSIYTHDEHIVASLDDLISRLDEALFIEFTPENNAEMQPLLKGMMMAFMDAEGEIRKRNIGEIEALNAKTEVECEELCGIEDNTEENVELTKKMVTLLDEIKKSLTGSRRTRRGGSTNPQDIFEETIPDPTLNTEWLATTRSDYNSFEIDIDRH